MPRPRSTSRCWAPTATWCWPPPRPTWSTASGRPTSRPPGPRPPAAWVFLDCNLERAVLADAIRRAAAGDVRLAVDAVSAPKAARLPADLRGVSVLFCNGMEARAWAAPAPAGHGRRGGTATTSGWPRPWSPPVPRRWCSAAGWRAASSPARSGTQRVPAAAADAVDMTGAGDALVAGTLAGLARGERLADAVRLGSVLAALTVETEESVRADLTADLLAAEAGRRPWLVPEPPAPATDGRNPCRSRPRWPPRCARGDRWWRWSPRSSPTACPSRTTWRRRWRSRTRCAGTARCRPRSRWSTAGPGSAWTARAWSGWPGAPACSRRPGATSGR